MGDIDLLHPPKELELRRHKKKRLVQSPNSFFMDVKCPGCFNMCVAIHTLAAEPRQQLFSFTRSSPPHNADPCFSLSPLFFTYAQYDGLQPRAVGRHLQRLLDGALPADWW